MERMLTKKAVAAGCTIEVTVMNIGEDLQICLAGGEKPHIGCVVQTVPRQSLTGDGSWSATSSVWNRTGHKDEVLCRMLAEKICSACRVVTVCSGGVHIDGITREQIREVMDTVERMGNEIAEELISCEADCEYPL